MCNLGTFTFFWTCWFSLSGCSCTDICNNRCFGWYAHWVRETVLNRDYDDTLTFINDCNTVLSHSEHSYKPKFSNNSSQRQFHQHQQHQQHQPKLSSPTFGANFHSYHSSSLPSNSYHSNPINSQYPKPHYQSQQCQQSNNQHCNRQATPIATPIYSQPFRDLSSVTCYKCN